MPTPTFTPCQSIDEVIERILKIVAQARGNNHCEGYFASLYLAVTREVKRGIETGYYDDGPRMEKLDVIFANLYLEAFHAYKNGLPLPESWRIAFDGGSNNRHLVLQHLLLGMNAHINLDLGIATSKTVGIGNIEEIKNDFYKINEVLIKMMGGVRSKINRVSPLFGWVEKIAQNRDEMLAAFSLKLARDGAWRYAQTYHHCPIPDRENSIKTRDEGIAILARNLSQPKGKWLNFVLKIARLTEWRSPASVIDFLNAQY